MPSSLVNRDGHSSLRAGLDVHVAICRRPSPAATTASAGLSSPVRLALVMRGWVGEAAAEARRALLLCWRCRGASSRARPSSRAGSACEAPIVVPGDATASSAASLGMNRLRMWRGGFGGGRFHGGG